jgi:hypothetical protein
MKKEVLALLAISIVAIIGASFLIIYSMTSKEKVNTLTYTSAVCIYTKPSGATTWNLLGGECSHNNVTNAGLNWTIAKISGVKTTTASPATVIALGNYTSAETSTITLINNTANNQAIPDCGLVPVNVTSPIDLSTATTANYSVSNVFTDSNCANLIVNTTALYNNTANGTSTLMFAGKNFSASVTLQNGDQLNVTWYVWASSGG